MKFNFNREKLSNVLHDFYNVTGGINITILDENFVSFGVHTNQINEFLQICPEKRRSQLPLLGY